MGKLLFEIGGDLMSTTQPKHYNVGEKNSQYGKTGELAPGYGKHPSAASRAKMSAAQKNRVFSQESLTKMSMAQRKRFEDPAEHEKLKKAQSHRVVSLETRAKMSASHKKRCEDPAEREKFQARLRNFYQTEEGRKTMRECHLGENNGRWLGGISFEPYCPKFNPDLKRRIRAFFDHRCVLCGKGVEENGKRKQLMACHHVEYDKTACCTDKPVHFAALCMKCHVRTNAERERWESMIHRIIEEIYEGRSYFTKDEWENMKGIKPHKAGFAGRTETETKKQSCSKIWKGDKI
jgi:hypothetical protein